MLNKKLDKEEMEFDAFSDSYFECITACSLSGDEIDCITQCVTTFFTEDFNHD